MKWYWPWRRDRHVSVQFRKLGWDVHSHLVPGVDDGATDIDSALDMLRAMVALGYKGMVLTPHIMADLYPNSRETLEPAFDQLVQATKAAQIPIELQLAAEYLLDVDCLAQLKMDDVMTFTCLDASGISRRVLLLEFGFHQPPELALVKEVLFEAQTRGITPLLAHCERYPYVHKNNELLHTWVKHGGWMSVNAASLSGAYGPETRNMARTCMEKGWVSFLCSDAHGMRHVRALESLSHSRTVSKWMANGHSLHAGLGR